MAEVVKGNFCDAAERERRLTGAYLELTGRKTVPESIRALIRRELAK